MTRIIEWAKSSRKGKKYMVLLDSGKIVHFGSSDYQQYRDSTPLKLYSSLDHLDVSRRNRYFARHKNNYAPYTPDWLSKRFLWS